MPKRPADDEVFDLTGDSDDQDVWGAEAGDPAGNGNGGNSGGEGRGPTRARVASEGPGPSHRGNGVNADAAGEGATPQPASPPRPTRARRAFPFPATAAVAGGLLTYEHLIPRGGAVSADGSAARALAARAHSSALGGAPAGRRLAARRARQRAVDLAAAPGRLARGRQPAGVLCLDLDSAERRYLLAGVADASLCIFDVLAAQRGAEEAARRAEEGREGEEAGGGGRDEASGRAAADDRGEWRLDPPRAEWPGALEPARTDGRGRVRAGGPAARGRGEPRGPGAARRDRAPPGDRARDLLAAAGAGAAPGGGARGADGGIEVAFFPPLDVAGPRGGRAGALARLPGTRVRAGGPRGGAPDLAPPRVPGSGAVLSITRGRPDSHSFSVSAVAWYPRDSGLFVSGSFDHQVRVWDAERGEAVRTIDMPARVYALAASASAAGHALVAIGTGNRDVALLDLRAPVAAQVLSAHSAGVWAACWGSGQEHTLATGGVDGRVLLWDVRQSGGPVGSLDAGVGGTRRRRASGGGGRAAVAAATDAGGSAAAADRADPPHAARGGPTSPRAAEVAGPWWVRARAAAMAATSTAGAATGGARSWFSSTSEEGGQRDPGHLPMRTWRVGSPPEAVSPPSYAPFGALRARLTTARAHAGSVTSILSPGSGERWLTAGTDDAVRSWRSDTLADTLCHFPDAFNHATKARAMAYCSTGDVLYCPTGSAIAVYDGLSGASLTSLKGGHFESINACLWNERAEELYSASGDGQIVVWAPRGSGRSRPAPPLAAPTGDPGRPATDLGGAAAPMLGSDEDGDAWSSED